MDQHNLQDQQQSILWQIKIIKDRLLIKSGWAEEAELRLRLIDLRYKFRQLKIN
jgi:hypothetical protein